MDLLPPDVSSATVNAWGESPSKSTVSSASGAATFGWRGGHRESPKQSARGYRPSLECVRPARASCGTCQRDAHDTASIGPRAGVRTGPRQPPAPRQLVERSAHGNFNNFNWMTVAPGWTRFARLRAQIPDASLFQYRSRTPLRTPGSNCCLGWPRLFASKQGRRGFLLRPGRRRHGHSFCLLSSWISLQAFGQACASAKAIANDG